MEQDLSSSLTGLSAVVTGGGQGIGYAIAERLLTDGARVLIADQDAQRASDAVERLGKQSDQVDWCHADVTDPAAGAAIAGRCLGSFGSFDILVNNAGVYPMAPFLEVSPDVFDRVFGVNVRGLFFASQAAARDWVERGVRGVILNVASMAGFHPVASGLSVYAASKAAVVHLTKSLARELGEYGIRAVAIAPGSIVTEGFRQQQVAGAVSDSAPPGLPLGRRGEPDEVASVAAFLVSSAARYVTGETVLIDGGLLLA